MESEHVRQEVYQITVLGHLDSEWSDWFDGLTITMVDNGETVLSGPLVDQTALHGVLIKIRDLGLPLLSLTHTEPGGVMNPIFSYTQKRRDAPDEGCKKAHLEPYRRAIETNLKLITPVEFALDLVPQCILEQERELHLLANFITYPRFLQRRHHEGPHPLAAFPPLTTSYQWNN